MNNFKNEILKLIRSIGPDLSLEMENDISETEKADLSIPEINIAFKFHLIDEQNIDESRNLDSAPTFKLIHVWEDHWVFHHEKIESKIRSLLGKTFRVHGRETKVASITNPQLIEFLKLNHLNVPIKGKYKFGLMKDDELLAVISFSNGREMIRDGIVYNSYELLRFCNKLNVTVVGGFTKLLNHFIKKRNPDDIMTYVDCDWSDGKTFESIGFELVERTPPLHFWLDPNTGIRHYPNVLLKELNVSEDSEDMDILIKEKGLVKVFNSGSFKFLRKFK